MTGVEVAQCPMVWMSPHFPDDEGSRVCSHRLHVLPMIPGQPSLVRHYHCSCSVEPILVVLVPGPLLLSLWHANSDIQL